MVCTGAVLSHTNEKTNIMAVCDPIGTASANPQNSVESDHGCRSRIYFDNAGDNVTLTLYNVTLTSHKP